MNLELKNVVKARVQNLLKANPTVEYTLDELSRALSHQVVEYNHISCRDTRVLWTMLDEALTEERPWIVQSLCGEGKRGRVTYQAAAAPMDSSTLCHAQALKKVCKEYQDALTAIINDLEGK